MGVGTPVCEVKYKPRPEGSDKLSHEAVEERVSSDLRWHVTRNWMRPCRKSVYIEKEEGQGWNP